MSEVITGWFAYLISTNSMATFLFVGVMFLALIILIWLQVRKDTYDLRAIISNYVDGKYVPATDKTLLVGTWVVSTYLTILHYSDSALGAYLTLWVANSGIKALVTLRGDGK